jgi:hypothetical protein
VDAAVETASETEQPAARRSSTPRSTPVRSICSSAMSSCRR